MTNTNWDDQLNKSKQATDRLKKTSRNILILCIVVTLLSFGGLAAFILTDNRPTQPLETVAIKQPTPALVPSTAPEQTPTPTTNPVTPTPEVNLDFIKDMFPEIVTDNNFVKTQNRNTNNASPSVILNDADITTYYTEYNTNEPMAIAMIETKTVNGIMHSSYPRFIIKPSNVEGSTHISSPSVISGEFSYNGSIYNHLMAFQATRRDNQQDNTTRLALSIDGSDWIPVPSNLFELKNSRSETNNHLFQGGLTEPSIINLDEKGTVAIFNTLDTGSNTHAVFEVWDLSVISEATQLITRTAVTNSGIVKQDGTQDFIESGDFMLSGNALTVATSTHTTQRVTAIKTPATVSTYRISIDRDDLKSSLENGTWEKFGEITNEVTTFSRNYQPSLVRDIHGARPTPSILSKKPDISIFFTITAKNSDTKNQLVITNFLERSLTS